jgi:hypothetical protein
MTETGFTVRFGREHLDAVRAATRMLQSEQRVLERYHCHSTALALQIDDLEELVDRMSGAIGVKRVLEAVS